MPLSLKVTLLFLGLIVRSLAQGQPSIEVNLYSTLLVEGERTLLTVEVKNATVIDWPDSPTAAPLVLERGDKGFLERNGIIREVFEYTLSTFKPGVYTLPPFKLRTDSGIVQSKPVSIRVFPFSDLATKGITIRPDVVPYLTGTFVEKKSPYVGETQNVEAKLYVPHAAPHLLRLYDGQVIQMEKDGIAAWRFTTEQQPTGVLKYENYNFAVYTYRSSVSALREGPLNIGPGEANPVFLRRVAFRGGFSTKTEAFPIEFPAREITARPLPDGAPSGFAGAVGNFSLTVAPVTRAIKFGDTMTIEASVTGSGNIDQFPGPSLVDPLGDWKQFDMIAKPPGSERRSSLGTVEFSQVIRPIKSVPALPPYQFVFFDPVLEKYRTLESPPQAIIITGSTDLSEAESDTSLPFLTPSGTPLLTFGRHSSFPLWIWQIIPALILLTLLLMISRRVAASRRLTKIPAQEFSAELDQLRAFSDNRITFYREAAKFATTWHGEEGFEEIFETRDEICFLPDTQPEPVPKPEQNRILNLLKSLSPVLITGLLLLQTNPLRALDQDPAKAKAETLSLLESDPAPEHFFNLALCEKALDQPGKAALWAYRFKAQKRDASKIFDDLPGIRAKERKGTDWVSYFPKSLYLQAFIAGAWALAIFIVATRA